MVAIIAIGGYAFPSVTERVVEKVKLGANSGPDFYNHLNFKQGFTTGGTNIATSSTATAYTLTTNEIRPEVGLLTWTPNVNTTLTTMASTSAPLANLAPGESFSLYLYNASTTAASTITLAAGTGIDFQKNEDTADLAVNGLDVAKLTFLKQADTDVFLIMEEWVEAD